MNLETQCWRGKHFTPTIFEEYTTHTSKNAFTLNRSPSCHSTVIVVTFVSLYLREEEVRVSKVYLLYIFPLYVSFTRTYHILRVLFIVG